MKRVFTAIIILSLSAVLFACGTKEKNADTTAAPVSERTDVPGLPTASEIPSGDPSSEQTDSGVIPTPGVTDVHVTGFPETEAPESEEPTLQITECNTFAPADTSAPKPTETPAKTSVPVPSPSVIPIRKEQKITDLPDYYFDFTIDGEELMYFTRASNMHVDFDYAGIILRGSSSSNDPHIYLTEQYIRRIKINPAVYRYVAMRLKSNRTDMNFELRFGTESADNLNACVSVPYADTKDWQTIVFKFEDAKSLTSVTLNGSALTQYRFDFFDGSAQINSGDQIILESMAFFKTRAEAEAYAGLYK